MITEPPLAIVIPSHARTDYLRPCLQAVLAFAPAGTEVIVVDDGSRHGCVSRLAETFPGVKVLRHSRPRGFCAAVNAGIAAVHAPIVELLNDDAEPTPGWAEAALKTMADPAIAAAAPLVLRRGPRGPVVDSAGDHYDPGGFATPRFRNRCLQRLTLTQLQACEVNSVSACAGFFRRNDLLAIGGFPEAFRAYFDDVDVSQRLRRLGRSLRFVPDSVVWHAGSATHGRQNRRALIELQSRNEEWLFWRQADWRQWPRHAAVLLGKSLLRLEEGTFGPWLAGRIRALITAAA